MDLTSTTDPERIPVAPSLFGGGLGLDLLYFSCSFNLCIFFCVPGHVELWQGSLRWQASNGAQNCAPLCIIRAEGKHKLWHTHQPLQCQERSSSSLADGILRLIS